jgi:hypothetical protein
MKLAKSIESAAGTDDESRWWIAQGLMKKTDGLDIGAMAARRTMPVKSVAVSISAALAYWRSGLIRMGPCAVDSESNSFFEAARKNTPRDGQVRWPGRPRGYHASSESFNSLPYQHNSQYTIHLFERRDLSLHPQPTKNAPRDGWVRWLGGSRGHRARDESFNSLLYQYNSRYTIRFFRRRDLFLLGWQKMLLGMAGCDNSAYHAAHDVSFKSLPYRL